VAEPAGIVSLAPENRHSFKADLLVDAEELVLSYEHLFERVSSPP
jgi:hypothetical protein